MNKCPSLILLYFSLYLTNMRAYQTTDLMLITVDAYKHSIQTYEEVKYSFCARNCTIASVKIIKYVYFSSLLPLPFGDILNNFSVNLTREETRKCSFRCMKRISVMERGIELVNVCKWNWKNKNCLIIELGNISGGFGN